LMLQRSGLAASLCNTCGAHALVIEKHSRERCGLRMISGHAVRKSSA
jgi:hypothetical protein